MSEPKPLIMSQPDCRPHMLPDGSEGYRLYANDVLRWEAEGRTWELRAYEGFLYDGASNPWWLWTLTGIAPDGLHRKAALYHDLIYQYAGELPEFHFFRDGVPVEKVVNGQFAWSREQADKLFSNVLKWCGVTERKRRWMYRGVRLAGWRPWNKSLNSRNRINEY